MYQHLHKGCLYPRICLDLALAEASRSTGATRVKVFSHLIRNNSREDVEAKVTNDPSFKDNDVPVQDVVPARFIHIDQSNYGAVEVLRDNIHPPGLAQRLKKTRWSIINCWRPIKPIYKVCSFCLMKSCPLNKKFLGSAGYVRLAYS